jgi:hypothetical protein
MTLYFGGMPDVIGMPLILFILLSVSGYLRFHREPRLSTFVPFLAAFTIAGLCDWPAYVIVPVFVGHFIVTRPRTKWPWILGFGVTAVALFVAMYVYITLATHSPWTWMLPLFVRHSAMAKDSQFTLPQWLTAAAAINRTFHTLPLMIGCGFWFLTFGCRLRRTQRGATIARLLLAWGTLCLLLGSDAAYDHSWMWLVLTPGVAVSTALLIEGWFHATERSRFAPVMSLSVSLIAVMFASWTGYTTFKRLYPTIQAVPFSPMEMGEAIRVAAPDSSDLALVFGGEDVSGAQLWFYGDRALRVNNIWSIQDVEEHLREDTADLIFDFNVQPWKATATGIVFPRMWDHDYGQVRAFLEERYPAVSLPPALSDKFDVFKVPRQ